MMLNFIVIAVLLFCAAVFIVPATLAVVGVVKRKKRLSVICGLILFVEILIVAAYFVLFPTCFPYVDLYIIGKTKAEITAVYGEPNYKFREEYGYIIGKDNGFFGLMKSNNDFYYYIYFDENGIAKSVEEGIQPGG